MSSSKSNNGFDSDMSSPKNQRLSFLRESSASKMSSDDDKEIRPNTVGVFNNDKFNSRGLYREFVKMFLKIKFEKLDNDHFGQKISQNFIWEQVQKQCIPKDKWKDFILAELKNFKKYDTKKKKDK